MTIATWEVDVTTTHPSTERGDAGLPLLLISPLLLIIVLHLINATHQLYERREAYATAATATRIANQADPIQVRVEQSASIDEGKSSDAVRRYAASAGYRVNELTYLANGDGTITTRVVVERDIDYIFPIPTLLPDTITGEAESILYSGVTGPGT